LNAIYRPFVLACALFLAVEVVFLFSLAFLSENIAGPIAFLPYISAFACGVLLGHLARTRVSAQLILLGCCIAIGFGVLNSAYEVLIGPVDFPGLSGSGFVILMSLPLVVVLCLAGGGLGVALRGEKHA
jgi:hypothetical protein